MTTEGAKQAVSQLRGLLEDLSGQDSSAVPGDVTFSELGFDSLVLTQLAQAVSKRFKTKISLRQLMEDFSTIDKLARHLGQSSPSTPQLSKAEAPQVVGESSAQQFADLVRSQAGKISQGTTTPRANSGILVELVEAQLEIMSRQLALLAGEDLAHRAPVAAEVESKVAPQPGEPPKSELPAKGHGPQLVISKQSKGALTPTQARHLERLTADYSRNTAASKAFTERNRPQIADPRVPAGFKPELKELVYPIVVKRSLGCRLWDVDGREYVDLLSGYGSNFLGFGAPFVKQAIQEQLEIGFEIGPQTDLVEEVAHLFRKLVPAERVAFCNTGSEAVLATFRIARTVTGRDTIIVFEGGYHGLFDEVVVRSGKEHRGLPAAPGIPRSATENIVVLPWNDDSALDYIKENADDIAAVVVEPVQSRRPEVVPHAFLKQLRSITEATGSVLVFDEVVTGFRVAPGGAQEFFGIQADLASYGKVVGGGLSIGIVAGKAEFMDALDGGAWRYGDASFPEVGVTYFAGTFVRHPLHLAASRAVLRHLIESGPSLQERVNQAAEEFAHEIRALAQVEGAPLKVLQFSSILKFEVDASVPLGEILFCHLRNRGVHVWAGRPCFLTAAHGPDERAFVVAAFREAMRDMQAGGFFPAKSRSASAAEPPVPGARLGRDRAGRPTWFIADPKEPDGYREVGKV